MTMPNFLVIGVQKAGTASLYRYMMQHPQIYMSSVKEPHFFAYEGENLCFNGPGDQEFVVRHVVTKLDDYCKLFRKVDNETAIGEASATYIYIPKAPERIRHYVPHVKLIAILRHPVERAYSSYWQLVRDAREPITDFAQALDAEEARIRNDWLPIWHYKAAGFYYAQLSRYYEIFPKDRIKICLYEDLSNDPTNMLRSIFRFLHVDDAFVANTATRYNVSGAPRNAALHMLHRLLVRPGPIKKALRPLLPEGPRRRLRQRVVKDLRDRAYTKPPPLTPEIRERLMEDYREDILNTQDLIQRDLSGWLK